MRVASVRTGAGVAPLLYENCSATPVRKFDPYRSSVAEVEAGSGLGLTELITGVGTCTDGAVTSNENWLDDWLPSSTLAYHVAAVVPKLGLSTNCVELREVIGLFG